MEEKANKKATSLKHRFTQLLLGSSCTTTAATSGAAKLVKLSSPLPQVQDPPEVHSDCGHDKRPTQLRRKLDRSTSSSVAAAAATVYSNCFTPRVVPAAQVPLECTARHSVHTSEPSASRKPRVENGERKKERRLSEGAEFCHAFSRDGKKLSPAFASSRTPGNSNHRLCHREEEAQSKKNASEKKCNGIRKEKTMKKLSSNAYGFSSSSSFHSGNDFGFCTSDEEEEEEESACTLFSSRSFSSDSSEFYKSNRKKNSRDKRNRNASMKSTGRRPQRPPRSTATEPRKQSWNAGYKSPPLVSYSSSQAAKQAKAAADANGVAAAGLAVVKRSRDPYTDFRSSMVEMIVEKNISSPNDLEDLLQSYLSLNASRHHPAIVEAFSDVWDAIFCCLD